MILYTSALPALLVLLFGGEGLQSCSLHGLLPVKLEKSLSWQQKPRLDDGCCHPSCLTLVDSFDLLCITAGHNSDGKFIARAQRIEFDCELIPRRVAIFIEKSKDGQIMPVPNVVVRDVACGANHTVRGARRSPWL